MTDARTARAARVVAFAGVVLAAGLFGAGCSGQTSDQAANESVLRTSRLAGYPAAEVGADRSEAAVMLVLPAATSAADIELAWQTGMAILSEAYPKSSSYRVLVRTGSAMLLSVSGGGSEVRESVTDDDPTALRDTATFGLLSDVNDADAGELLPAAAARTEGRERDLDAENRAGGLATPTGPIVRDTEALKAAWRRAYADAPGIPAPPGGTEEAARFAADRIERALSGYSIDGEEALGEVVADLVAERDVTALREWAVTAEAIGAGDPLASLLALTASAAREVIASVNGGEGAGPSPSPTGGAIGGFEREPAIDATGSIEGTGVVPATLTRYGVTRDGVVGLAWRSTESSPPSFAAAAIWECYRAPDGALYWVAGDQGEVALADTSLRGWGYDLRSAELVDADNVARSYETYPLWQSR